MVLSYPFGTIFKANLMFTAPTNRATAEGGALRLPGSCAQDRSLIVLLCVEKKMGRMHWDPEGRTQPLSSCLLSRVGERPCQPRDSAPQEGDLEACLQCPGVRDGLGSVLTGVPADSPQ
jgi:hypothetical protein